MPPGFPPGGFSYIYFFLLCLVGRRGVVCGGPRSVARQGYTVARWRPEERGAAGLHGGALAAIVRLWQSPGVRGRTLAGILRRAGERGIMGAAAHPNTKNPTGRRGSFYSFYKSTRLELVAKGKAEHIALAVGVAHGDRPGLRIRRAV